MYKVFDYRCTGCSYYAADKLVEASKVEAQVCPECGYELVPLPPATRTNFRFADTRLK